MEAKEGAGALPLVEVPGGYRDPQQGKELATLRLEEARARQLVLRGTTSCRRFAPGHTFALSGAPREDLNRRWLLLEVRWEARDGAATEAGERRFQAEFVAVPIETPYRPERSKPPTLGGVQTAVVTGPPGAEIHTNAHGQSTSLLRWDRRGSKDDRSSAWIRPLQPQTSGGMFLPRVGWEALLAFSGTSADTPYVLGRLDNGAAPPAEGLPAKKVRSAFGSSTTPGGGSANVMRTDDAAGQEDMLLNASSDYNERTESDKTVAVSANDRHTIGANRTQIVGLACAVGVDAAQSTSVGASRSVTVGGGMFFGLGSESVAVGAARLFDTGGDYSTDVKGALVAHRRGREDGDRDRGPQPARQRRRDGDHRRVLERGRRASPPPWAWPVATCAPSAAPSTCARPCARSRRARWRNRSERTPSPRAVSFRRSSRAWRRSRWAAQPR